MYVYIITSQFIRRRYKTKISFHFSYITTDIARSELMQCLLQYAYIWKWPKDEKNRFKNLSIAKAV